jgi:error-prone DNA polymerase
MEGPLLRDKSHVLREENSRLPLQQMTTEECLISDYAGTGLAIGKHPMAYRRDALRRHRVSSAEELRTLKNGDYVKTVGMVIARQRLGTAMGFIFLSMEDETGIANVIVTPDLYERERLVVTRAEFIQAEGPLQHQDGVIHVKAMSLRPLSDHALVVRSHDFH